MAVTLAKIAELAGVSRGTVDRALNNRGRVDPQVAERIKKIAKEQDYQPNRAGKALALAKNPIKIGVIVQSASTAFMRLVLEGIDYACESLGEHGAQVIVRTIDGIDAEQELRLIDELIELGIGGLAIAPVNDPQIQDRLIEVTQQLPVVTFNSDMPDCGRMCFVGQDTTASGRCCAGLMNMLLGGKGKVLVITGHPSNLSHMCRSEGFMNEIHTSFPGIELLPLEKCYDRDEIAHEIVCDTLRSHIDLAGIFVSANGQVGVCRALRELGVDDRVRVICYDITPPNIENVRNGAIDFLIGQDSFAQGTRPAQILYDYLFTGAKPEKELLLTDIEIKTRYNL